MRVFISLLILLVLTGGAVPATLFAAPNEEEARKICARFEHYTPGPDARPTDEDRRLVTSKSLVMAGYIELVSDRKGYEEARRYCLVKGDCNRELAMIFANGWGVRRDYDAATYFLCRAEGEIAPFEQWGMIEHVQNMQKSKKPDELTYCNNVTSGAGQLYCMQIDAARKAPEWEKKIKAAGNRLDEAARQRFDELVKAADAFAEMDGGVWAESRGGTMYPAEVVSGRTEAKEAFVTALGRYTKTRATSATEDVRKRADRSLNKAYKAAMASGEDGDPEFVAGGRELLRDSQRAWIKYRDAWIAFYQARWKGGAAAEVLGREIETALSLERTKKLLKLSAAE